MMVLIPAVLFLVSLSATRGVSPEKITACAIKSPCACVTDTGKVIDLSSLGKDSGGRNMTKRLPPMCINNIFTDLNSGGNLSSYLLTTKNKQKGWDFTWKPCKEFKVKGITDKVSAYQHVKSGDKYYDIGSTANVQFEVQDGSVIMGMVSTDYLRASLVNLTCDPDKTEWDFSRVDSQTTFIFTLKSPKCCTGDVPQRTSTSTLSVGSILLIVFFTILVMYIIVGVIVQQKVRKAEGREVIPNISFWSAFPGLIRDGFKFVFTCGSRRTTYNKI